MNIAFFGARAFRQCRERLSPSRMTPAMTEQKPQPKVHPSGDNRFKLLDRAVMKHQASGTALIEVLHAAQGIFGFLDSDLLIYIAHALKLPQSRVYGVATFYHFFTLKPKGEHTFVLCMGTACYVKGAGQIQHAVEECCKTKFGSTTPDNRISLVSARCVGSCGIAPVAVLDDQVAGKLNVEGALKRIKTWQDEPREVTV
jgi:bidirectional [NiFe] hydrogenase diaphorase subunit